MPEIGTTGVVFDKVAREVRCKWSATDGNDKQPLAAAQALLVEHLPKLKGASGVVSVQRIVCGGCFDFKVVQTFTAEAHSVAEGAGYPEATAFETALKAIPGVSSVESQTFTIETL